MCAIGSIVFEFSDYIFSVAELLYILTCGAWRFLGFPSLCPCHIANL